jgi:hypothetical protein
MSTITPTIGRKVWYYDFTTVGCNDPHQPYDATVIYVWGNDCVNLDVTDHHGNRLIKTSVPLRDPQDSACHGVSSFATWMPYQVGQARKE